MPPIQAPIRTERYATGRWSLAAALTAAIAAASWIGGENGGSAALSRAGGEPAASTALLALVPSTAKLAAPYVVTLPQRALAREPVDMFANRLSEPPPVERAPEPPTLPFIYVGSMVVDGEVTVFLETQDRMHAIKAGQAVDDQYRIDEVDGDTVSLIYLPLGVRQTLQLRGLSDTAHIADAANAPASSTGRRARRARLDAMPATPR